MRRPIPLAFLTAYAELAHVAQRRKELSKRAKDLQQAKELIDIFLETDNAALQEVLDDARNRGKAWKTAVNSSLREMGRDARLGRLPLPLRQGPA